jgi:hypothetical protein
MAEIRVIFGDDDRENEEFLGFVLDNIEESEERCIRQLDVLNDLLGVASIVQCASVSTHLFE